MALSVDVQGQWWLPDRPEHPVFGTFRWDDDSGGELDLAGELQAAYEDITVADGSTQRMRVHRAAAREYPVVLGEGNNQLFTLLDCLQSSHRRIDFQRYAERVHVNRLLLGSHTDRDEELQFERVITGLRHLTAWVGMTGLERNSDHEKPGVFSSVTAKVLPPMETQIDDGKLRLFQGLAESGDHVHDLGLRQSWSFDLDLDHPEPLDRLAEVASDLQDLITIAAGKPASFESFFVRRSSDSLSLGLEESQYLARWTSRAEPTAPVRRHEMYFTFDGFGGIDGVGRWLSVANQFRTHLNRVMATRYNAAMYLEDRILNVCATLESFDKARRNEKAYYVDRVSACVAFAGQPFQDVIRADPAEWAKLIKKVRNDLAHHDVVRLGGRNPEYLVLVEQLFWLFAMCMLRLADAPDPVFASIANHGQIRWVTSQSERVLPKVVAAAE